MQSAFAKMICNNNSKTSTRHSFINNITTSLPNGFLKFLKGRRRIWQLQMLNHCPKFATSHYLSIYKLSLILLLLSTNFDVTDACNSRTVPRPRTTPAPQSTTTTSRPNITFQTFKCPLEYATWYCLNGATCFTVKIGKEVLYNCECPDGYIGPRCDYKDADGSYLAGRQRVMLETASIGGGAVAAVFVALVIGFVVYVKWHQNDKRKEQDVDDLPQNGHHNEAVDDVDGPSRVVLFIGKEAQVNSSSQSCRIKSNCDRINVKRPHRAVVQVHQPLPRPFGPHHDYPLSMETVLLKNENK